MISKNEDNFTDNVQSERKYYESEEDVQPLKVGDIIQNRFLISQQIGEGSFGSVFKVLDRNNNNATWAMKVEIDEDDENSLLEREIKVLIELRKQQGFPQIKFYGQERGYTYCIMTLLGKNLEQIFRKLGCVMNQTTVLRLAIQMIDRISVMHDNRFLHRDIKPDNFVIESGPNAKMLYLIDFGLSKHYINSKGEHISYVKKAGLIGTARYASVSAHEEMEQGRKDDLESIGYVLIYLATGNLPWMNLQVDSKDAKYTKIYQIKKQTKTEDLCANLPKCFYFYMNDVKSLEFQETPKYDKLKSYFEREIEILNKQTSMNSSQFTYDWERLPEYSKQKKHQTVHVMQNQEKRQQVEIAFNPHKLNQVNKQNQFINQQTKDSQQKSTQNQQLTFEQIMNEKRKGTKKTVYSPTGKSKKPPLLINIVENSDLNKQNVLSPIKPDDSRLFRMQNHSSTLLQIPQLNSSYQLDSYISPSVATSRLNNYFESEDVVSEGGGLPIWDLCDGSKPEFQKVTGILEGIKKPSLIILRKERKAHTYTVKLMQELFVPPIKLIGDQESNVEGLE
ncbi:unnamed protein product (macronuclear) [Paramecium tetraurelia]|uniref:Casein kinase I n=1 Tax=Paramecium tetraurelia TaxID=5888 RepID=A0CYW2_PARTE|nr:uncharacterized protein GSPATT00011580001 [Paramecium tetraurelia]CAK75979.1 unnamed protein product [Paramecium tetraurelia]|eukprot:XP_001443376.1 hypothetical protein (macronuclear) [Paramecium tetraurelia strain d4-2]